MTLTRNSLPARTLVTAAAMMLMTIVCAGPMEAETCYSREHKRAVVNIRVALTAPRTAMDKRVVMSERECVLACCSGEVKPGR